MQPHRRPHQSLVLLLLLALTLIAPQQGAAAAPAPPLALAGPIAVSAPVVQQVGDLTALAAQPIAPAVSALQPAAALAESATAPRVAAADPATLVRGAPVPGDATLIASAPQAAPAPATAARVIAPARATPGALLGVPKRVAYAPVDAPSAAPAAAPQPLGPASANVYSVVSCYNATQVYMAPCYAETAIQGNVGSSAALRTFTKGNQKWSELTLDSVGSVYGLAYDEGNVSGVRRVFLGAYARRMTNFGPGGPGAIYEYNITTRTVRWIATVPNANINGHVTPYWDFGGRSTLYDNKMAPWVTRSSLGDIELSPSGRLLYVANLQTRTVMVADMTAANPDATWQTLYTATDGWVPFALKFTPARDVYEEPYLAIGLTHPTALDVKVVFHTTRPTAPNTSWTELYQDLDAGQIKPRGQTEWSDGWDAWADYPLAEDVNLPGEYQTHQPILSSISFNYDRTTMILGLRDRMGDQYRVWRAGSSNTVNDLFRVMIEGDTLVYAFNGGTGGWDMRTVGVNQPPSNTSDQCYGRRPWPAPSDFFRDNFHYGSFNAGVECWGVHPEGHNGAIAMNAYGMKFPPDEEFVTSMLDPFQQYSGGGYWYRLSPYAREPIDGTELIVAGRLGKSALVGDITSLCNYARIGVRAWRDADGDGVQDGGEAGIGSVLLDLIDGRTGQIVRQGTTDGNGWAYFIVEPNVSYTARAAASNWQSGGALTGTFVSPPLQGGDRFADSDIDQTTAAVALPGLRREMNHLSVGMGFTSNNMAQGVIGDRVWSDLNGNGRQDAGEPGITSTGTTATATLTCVSGFPVCPPGFPRTTTVDLSGNYLFQKVPPGNYAVQFTRVPALPPSPANATDDANDSDGNSSLVTPAVCVGLTGNAACPIQNLNLDQGFLAGADAQITKTGPPQAAVGDSFSYTLTWRNAGPSTAQGAVMHDTLPPGLIYVSASPAPTSIAGRTLTWYGGTVPAGLSGTITVNVRVDPALAAGVTSVTNSASVTTTTTDPTPGNNSATWTTAITRPDVTVAKAGPATALISDTLDFTLTYRNGGTAPAQGVRVVDTLPDGLAYVSASPAPTSIAGQALAWDIPGTLAAGASGTITVRARVLPAALVTQVNGAQISTTSPGDDAGNNSADSTTTILRPNVRIVKSAPATTAEKSPLEYRLRYENDGTVAAQDVVVQDTLPAGLTYVSASPAPTSVAGRTLTWNLGTLALGDSGVIRVTTTVDVGSSAGAAPQLINTGRIATTTPGDDPSDNSSTSETTVIPPPPPPPPTPDWQIAIRSTLDPLANDADAANGVYRSDSAAVRWPSGEVLDWTPRVRLTLPGAPPAYPYAYRARIVAWSLVSTTVGGVDRPAEASDDMPSHGAGCRAGDRSGVDGSGMTGCVYRYIGGSSLSDTTEPTEHDMDGQAHSYWSVGAPLSMRGDVYTFSLAQLGAVRLNVQVKVVVETYNEEDPAHETLATRTDIPSGSYTLTLVVPRDLK